MKGGEYIIDTIDEAGLEKEQLDEETSEIFLKDYFSLLDEEDEEEPSDSAPMTH